jgi:hypothetical protein
MECGVADQPPYSYNCDACSTRRRATCTCPAASEYDPSPATGYKVNPTPVPDPSDAEAYRADCARRGVDPGPMPALSWTGPDGFGWSVASYDGRVRFARDAVDVAVWHSSDDAVEWLARPGYAALSVDVPREVVARVVALATTALGERR